MINVTLDGHTYPVPECWADVPAEDVPRLLMLNHFEQPTGETQLSIIRTSLRIPGKVWRKLMQDHFSPDRPEAQRQANAGVLHDLSRLLAWMQEAPIEKKPFPYLLIDELAFWLPDEDFLTTTYGELIDAYVHFMAFTQQLVPGDKHLNLLCATLCRRWYDPGSTDYPNAGPPADWNGDIRVAYNEYSAALDERVMAGVPEGERMAVLLYFAGSLKRLFERYHTFGGGSGEPDAYPAQGLLKNLHLLSEKGIFGGMDKTKAANVHDVMLFLEEHRADELARQEAQNQAHE